MKKTIILFLICIIATLKIKAQPGAGLNFDGVNDHVQLSHFSRPQNMTIEAWVKTTFNGTGQIVGWAGSLGKSAEFKFVGGMVHYYEWDGSNWVGVPCSIMVNDNQWHHVAVVRTSAMFNNVSMYVDGINTNIGTVNLNVSTNALNIGAYNYGSLQQFYSGNIDEVRIWNRSLCTAEIQAHMNCELAPGQIGLLAYYKFNQGTAGANNSTVTTAPDASGNSNNGTLNNFALTGTVSNWVAPGGVSTGSTCPVFNLGLAATSATLPSCFGQTVNIIGSGATSYTWMPGSLTGATITVSPSVTTIYTLSATSASNCIVYVTSTVTVPAPNVTLSVANQSICAGAQTTLSANGANTYTWSTGATTSSIVVSPTVNTTYTVTGTSTLTGCSQIQTSAITVNSIAITISNTGPICANSGQSAVLVAYGAHTYTWNTGAQSSSVAVSPSVVTTYTVIGTSTLTGCSNSKTATVIVNPLPVVNAVCATPTICVGESAVLTATSSSTFGFVTWNPGGGIGVSTIVTPSVTTTYTVGGSDINNCNDTTTITIVVDACVGIFEMNIANVVFSIYPNPCNNKIMINCDRENRMMKILNYTGLVIQNEILENKKTELDLSNLSSGIYFIQIDSGIKKIIKN